VLASRLWNSRVLSNDGRSSHMIVYKPSVGEAAQAN
jgi:hypothetical protein